MEQTKQFYITIGHPCSKTAVLHKVKANLIAGKTPREMAKGLRKACAKYPEFIGFMSGIVFSPADLFWAVFEGFGDKNPIAASDNYYWRKK